MPQFSGIHHLAITVTDLEASTAFYSSVFGFPPAGELEGSALRRRIFTLPSGTNIGLTQHDVATSERFSPFRPGMDHVGFGVDSLEELRAWADHLDASGIAHSGLVEANYGTALSFTDPDGTALEFFVGA